MVSQLPTAHQLCLQRKKLSLEEHLDQLIKRQSWIFEFNCRCQPSTSLLIWTTPLYTDQDAGAQTRDVIRVFLMCRRWRSSSAKPGRAKMASKVRVMAAAGRSGRANRQRIKLWVRAFSMYERANPRSMTCFHTACDQWKPRPCNSTQGKTVFMAFHTASSKIAQQQWGKVVRGNGVGDASLQQCNHPLNVRSWWREWVVPVTCCLPVIWMREWTTTAWRGHRHSWRWRPGTTPSQWTGMTVSVMWRKDVGGSFTQMSSFRKSGRESSCSSKSSVVGLEGRVPWLRLLIWQMRVSNWGTHCHFIPFFSLTITL